MQLGYWLLSDKWVYKVKKEVNRDILWFKDK